MTANHQTLLQALPSPAAQVLCIGPRLDGVVADITRIAGADAQVHVLGSAEPLDVDAEPLPFDEGSINAVVLHDALRAYDEIQLHRLLVDCRRVLCDGGRLVVRDNMLPYARLSPRIGRTVLRVLGVRYTSNEVFAIMERAGFWDCLVLRNSALSTDVVVKGEKVVERQLAGSDNDRTTGTDIRVVR